MVNKLNNSIQDTFGFQQNYFKPNIFLDDIYVGRKKELQEILLWIECGQNLFLVGNKGMGKTSTYYKLIPELKKRNNYPIILPKAYADAKEFYVRNIREILKQVSEGVDFSKKQKKEIKEIKNRTLEKVDEVLLCDDFFELLRKIKHATDSDRVCVFIDETQEWRYKKAQKLFIDFHNPFFEQDFSFIVSVYPKVLRKIMKIDDAFIDRVRKRITLPPLSNSTVKELIRKRIQLSTNKQKDIDDVFSKSALRVLLDSCEGVPRNVVNLCSYSFQNAVKDNKSKVTAKHMQEAKNQAGIHESQLLFENLSNTKKKYLKFLFNKNGRAEFQEFVDNFNVTKGAVSQHLRALEEFAINKTRNNGNTVVHLIDDYSKLIENKRS